MQNSFRVVSSLDQILTVGTESMLDFAYDRRLLDGIAIGIVKDGQSYVRVAGDGITVDSGFEIGSVTKLYTAELISALDERHELSWRDAIELHLPKSTGVEIGPTHEPTGITLLDIATHRSGLPLLPPNLHITDGLNPYGSYSMRDLQHYLEKDFYNRARQKRYNYSNLGFAVLGYVAETVSKLSYEKLLTREILEPLSMTSTSLALTGGIQPVVVPGHSETGRLAPTWTQLAFAPTGALCSNIVDQLTWLKFLLSKRDRTTLQTYPDQNKVKRGLAWEIDPIHKTYERDGITGGFCSYAGVNPNKGWGVIILSSRKAQPIVRALAKNFERALEGRPMKPLRGSYGKLAAHIKDTVRNNKQASDLYRRLRSHLT